MVLIQLLKIIVRTQLLNCLPQLQTTPVSVYMAQSQPSNSRLHGREFNSLCPKAETKSSVLHDPKSTPNNRLHGRELNSLCPKWQRLMSALHSPKSTTNSRLFQNPQIPSPSLPGMTSLTLQPYFLSGVYYDNCDCHILCARVQNCTQCLCTWTKSWIVQSPTKLNDKI